MNTIAGIITYNPEIKRLKQNIVAIYPQVEKCIVVDNGSSNIGAVEGLCSSMDIDLIKNNCNFGVAKALNQVFEYAKTCGGGGDTYVLTLDQDSIVYTDMVDTYKQYLNIEGVASLTSLRTDRNYSVKGVVGDHEYDFVNKCITSGNLVRVDVWESVGRFNESLFIDMVDSEFCYRIRNHGYKILRINKVELVHELGDAFQKKFLGRKRTILNHNAFRRYYIFRNTVYLLRKYPLAHNDYSYKELAKSYIAILLFENDKWSKIKRSTKGVIDGIRM